METGWQLGRYFFLGHFYTSQFYELCSLFLSPSLPHSSLSYIQPQHSEFTLTLLLLTHRDCSVLNLRLVIFPPTEFGNCWWNVYVSTMNSPQSSCCLFEMEGVRKKQVVFTFAPQTLTPRPPPPTLYLWPQITVSD